MKYVLVYSSVHVNLICLNCVVSFKVQGLSAADLVHENWVLSLHFCYQPDVCWEKAGIVW